MIFVLLPVHNRLQLTRKFVLDLMRQDIDSYHLILVDDGSSDGTGERIAEILPPDKLTVLRGTGQLWWAGALQRAYDFLKSMTTSPDDAVLIANNDMEFDSDFLRNGLEVLGENPSAAIQAVGVDSSTGIVDMGAVANVNSMSFSPAEKIGQANCLSTRGLIMKMDAFKKSGGFRPSLLPHYLSDYEFSMRLAKEGTPLCCDSRFRAVVHLEMTGLAAYDVKNGLRHFFGQTFSYRAKYNPVHWSLFVILTARPLCIPLLVCRIWLDFARATVKTIHHSWFK